VASGGSTPQCCGDKTSLPGPSSSLFSKLAIGHINKVPGRISPHALLTQAMPSRASSVVAPLQACLALPPLRKHLPRKIGIYIHTIKTAHNMPHITQHASVEPGALLSLSTILSATTPTRSSSAMSQSSQGHRHPRGKIRAINSASSRSA